MLYLRIKKYNIFYLFIQHIILTFLNKKLRITDFLFELNLGHFVAKPIKLSFKYFYFLQNSIKNI